MNRSATCALCGGRRDSRAKTQRCQRCRAYQTTPAIDRVTDRVRIDSAGCWLWTGSSNPGGYGQIRLSVAEGARLVVTHHVTYEHFVGPIPVGLQLDHLCRVRLCCNPDHLEPVTQRENIRRGAACGPRKFRPCSICGVVFSGRTWAATCGAGCRSEAGRRAARKRWDVS